MKHSIRKNRWLPLILVVATVLTLLLVACTQGGNEETAPSDTAGVTSPSAGESTHEPDTVGSPSEEATEAPTEESTPAATETPTEEAQPVEEPIFTDTLPAVEEPKRTLPKQYNEKEMRRFNRQVQSRNQTDDDDDTF